MKKQPKNNYKRDIEHRERLRAKRDRIEGLRALMATHEQAGNVEEARAIGTRIRLAQQELRYMADNDNEDEINLVGGHL